MTSIKKSKNLGARIDREEMRGRLASHFMSSAARLVRVYRFPSMTHARVFCQRLKQGTWYEGVGGHGIALIQKATPAPKLVIKPGRRVLDPQNRVVEVVSSGKDFAGEYVDVRLAGSYRATIRYPLSCLSPTEGDDQ